MHRKTIAAIAAAAAAAVAFSAPAPASAACNTTTVNPRTSVELCVEAPATGNLAEVTFTWCLDWSFDCQTSTVPVARPVIG